MTFQAAMYRGTRPGLAGVYNYGVRKWEHGPYSHAEMIFSDGMAASSSFADGGVRFKRIEFDPAHWDFIDLPAHLEVGARQWFIDHEGEAYDLMGNAHFIIGFIPEARRKKFCSEALAAALGFPDPWRYGPNALASTLRFINRPAQLERAICHKTATLPTTT